MFTARKKIAKEKGQEPDSFEEQVAQVLLTATDQQHTEHSQFWGSL